MGTILLAAGGTGGHLFPAEALAHELTARGWEVHLVTDSRAERFAGRFPAKAIHTVASATIGSRNPVTLALSGLKLWRGFRQASQLIEKLSPYAVVGFGGYPTVPPLFAATRRDVPSIIHEQNAVMGRANKALASRVTAIAGGFLPDGEGAHAAKTVITGNPVRPAVIEAAKAGYEQSGDGEPFNLLVFGGSQGAQFFSEAVPAAVRLLPEEHRARLRIVQQARSEDEDRVRAAYAEMSVPAEVASFFTDMAERMAAAQLVICRAGASTVSELAVMGRPSILVPYPHALDHDQSANASALARAGGADVYDQNTLTPELIAIKIEDLMQEPQALDDMADAARSAGRPDATQALADLTEAIAAGKSIEEFKRRARP